VRLKDVNENKTKNGSSNLGKSCPNAHDWPSNYQLKDETAVSSTIVAMH
jgi:hypothetical protein